MKIPTVQLEAAMNTDQMTKAPVGEDCDYK